MPLAWWCAFSKNYGIWGLWMAFAIVGLLQDIGNWFIINWCDWKQIAADMKKALKSDKNQDLLI
jgi:hypothetical protein